MYCCPAHSWGVQRHIVMSLLLFFFEHQFDKNSVSMSLSIPAPTTKVNTDTRNRVVKLRSAMCNRLNCRVRLLVEEADTPCIIKSKEGETACSSHAATKQRSICLHVTQGLTS